MSEEQIILIGLIASLLTWGLKILATYANYKPSRITINVILYLVSVFLALSWAGAAIPNFPPFDGNIGAFATALWDYFNAWIAVAAPIVGSATLIYNILYERVMMPAFAKLKKK